MQSGFSSRFEVILCESDVCFGCVVVFKCDGGLVITDDCRQFPSSGHVFFCRQLHILLLSMVAAAVAVLSICIDAVRMRLLWLSIICLALFMQL